MRNGTWLVSTLSCMLAVGCSGLPADGDSPFDARDDGDLGVASETLSAVELAELACEFSEKQSPQTYRAKWDEIVANHVLANQFWHELLPLATGECADDVRDIFWNLAVPNHWNKVPVINGWPFPGAVAGYFTQNFWLLAVPNGWGDGYYTTKFWDDLVPNNKGPQVAPSTVALAMNGQTEAGYYNYWLWARAVPNGWANEYYSNKFWDEAVPKNWGPQIKPEVVAKDLPRKTEAGYYNYWFWAHAVPDGWANKYYRQAFWYEAVPDERGDSYMAVGGLLERGYYLAELYHYAMVYDWAYRDSLGMGYYGYYMHRPVFLASMSEEVRGIYADLLGLAGEPGYNQKPGYGYLGNATGEAPVNQWFAPDAKVVVIFTFDNHTHADHPEEACAVAKVLNSQSPPIPATMFLDSNTEGLNCLKSFHLGNHTMTHPKINRRPRFTVDGVVTGIDYQISALDVFQNNYLGRDPATHTFTAFRAPFADGQKTFDAEVADAFLAFGAERGVSLLSDSSVPYVSTSVDTILTGDDRPIPPGFKAFMTTKPYPFYVRGGLVEFPFVYPSDAVAASHDRDSFWAPPPWTPAPPATPEKGYTFDLWKAAFDEMYTTDARGVMTLLLHPQIIANWIRLRDESDGATPLLSALVQYMRKPGVYFSDMGEAAKRFNDCYAFNQCAGNPN